MYLCTSMHLFNKAIIWQWHNAKGSSVLDELQVFEISLDELVWHHAMSKIIFFLILKSAVNIL